MKFQNDYKNWIEELTRAKSGEVDFGVNWTLNGRAAYSRAELEGNREQLWRVSWIENTGELYAVEAGPGRFVLLAKLDIREEVEKALSGWAKWQSVIYQNIAALELSLAWDKIAEKRAKLLQTKKALVSPDFLEEIYEKIACGSLDMHDPTCSSAEVFSWRGKAWVSTSGTSSGEGGISGVSIREVVPVIFWDQSYNDLDARGKLRYLGGRFSPKGKPGQTWVMTGNYLDLIPDPDALPSPKQAEFAF